MTDQRRTQRFNVRFPVELVRAGNQPLCLLGETRNMSSAGVLFASDCNMAVGEAIEYIITLPGGEPEGETVQLRCHGRVLRIGKDLANHSGTRCAVAATVDRYEFLRQKRSYANSVGF